MNRPYKYLIIAAVSISFTSCKDDAPANIIPEPGVEVNFGGGLEQNITRTYYGDPTMDGDKEISYPIHWNDGTVKDKVFIFSPEAMTGRNEAFYTVNATAETKGKPAPLSKIGDTGIQWGSSETYNFYGFYPGNEDFNIKSSGSVLSASLPGEQTVTIETADYTDSGTVGGHNVTATPNMDYCMLKAVKTGIQATDNVINLEFEPFCSVFDITVNGPDESNTQTDVNVVRITSVEIIADAQISGGFSYDFASGTLTASANDEAAKTIRINTTGYDSEGNYVGVPLRQNETLKLKAFVIPNPNVKTVTVKVHTSDFNTYSRPLNISSLTGTTQVGMSLCKIYPVKLPKFLATEAQFDYSSWLAQLDPRIYINEISLPGSCLSFNTEANGMSGNTVTQTLDIAGQFQAGVRVFQAHCWPVTTASGPRLNLTTSSGRDTGIGLLDVITSLKNEMAANHGNEFCVLMLSDYKIEGSRYDFVEFYGRFKTLTDVMAAEGLLAENITPNTTINDVKGKIILKLQTNASVDGSGSDGVNSTLTKIQSWSSLNGSKALFNWFNTNAQSNLFYAPLQFGSVGSFEFTPGSTTWRYTKPVITSYTAGIAYDAAFKLINTTTSIGAIVTSGNTNCTSKPTTLDNATTMWYMYSEQANPPIWNSDFTNNIKNVVNSINDTYKQDIHNKFYMTYCGGTGGSNITTTGNDTWSLAIATLSQKPYGWVLFNDVNAATTQANIKTVISNNNDINFRLNRDRTKTNTKAPNGDVKGVSNGGNLFNN